MTTIDLGAPAPNPLHLLDGLPRRATLTLPELRYCASSAGDAPLPFVLDDAVGVEGGEPPAAADPLADRLGVRPAEPSAAAYGEALATLHDPLESLARRGLVTPDGVDPGLLGALGLLASPSVGVDIDVAAGDVRGKAWHRQRDEAVATLATVDGVVFELAWFSTDDWADELRRVPSIPEDVALSPSSVPELVDLPYELLDAAGEALRTHRGDLLDAVVATYDGTVVDGDGHRLSTSEIRTVVEAVHRETHGRIRAMLADVGGPTTTIGVISWVLLADGWHSLRPHRTGDDLRVEVRRVEPFDFATTLAPVLAEVTA
ncbi:hypothetical protein RDV89_10175 [Nocardioides zeae]|uniref:Uncharacterized protein n=1 Tax=Nocardioides imazamoxiresistens TaxID=3231893 RepID=A0ABU3PW55_9ACTN|nr:hypothetical protein [Nocardioides zeae]MDT9593434.1 hypothetical protein [Nocardioides zeae]